MVKEVRKVILTKEELIAALNAYKRTNFEFLPAGKIVSCELKADKPVIVGMETVSVNKIKVVDFTLEQPKLLDPLIRFCMEHSIVLPRNSRKTAQISDGQAALFIQMNTTDGM